MKMRTTFLSVVLLVGNVLLVPQSYGMNSAPFGEGEKMTQDSTYVNGITDKNRGDKEGPMVLKGELSGRIPSDKIYLYETEGRSNYKIDSAEINGGHFDFGTRVYKRGFYVLSLGSENNITRIIMNPDEAVVDLLFSNSNLAFSMQARESNENKAWADYSKFETRARNAIRAYKNNKAKTGEKEKFEALISKKEKEVSEYQKRVIIENPDTYLAKFLTHEQVPFLHDFGKYWSDIDFSDASIIRCTTIPTRMNTFMRTHGGGTDAGFLKCIDFTKAAAEKNPQVLEFVLYTMLDGFYQSNMENMCQYILDNYIFDEDCGADLSDVIRDRAQGIVSLQVGHVPPDFTIETHDGESLNMMEEVVKHRYTLLMFWSSWCHKCEQEIPVLKTVYQQYRDKGFGVIGISLDVDRQTWVNTVAERGMTWPNVSQLNMWKSEVAMDYRVTKTPILFLLNEKGEIVLKPKRIYEVRQFLNQNLK